MVLVDLLLAAATFASTALAKELQTNDAFEARSQALYQSGVMMEKIMMKKQVSPFYATSIRLSASHTLSGYIDLIRSTYSPFGTDSAPTEE
jgi:hypothetical protein